MALVRFEKVTRKAKRDFPAASIYVKMSRIVFNKATFKLLQEINKGEEVDNLVIYTDTDNKNVFYAAPAKADATDARKLGKTSKTGRFLDGKRLMKSLDWNFSAPTTLKVERNKKGNMIKISKNAVV